MKGLTWKDVAEGVIVVLLGILAFMGREMYAKQYELAASQAELTSTFNERLHTIDTWRATIDASRFSASDWLQAKQAIDATDTSLDKRITRAEDTYAEIKKQLDRLEQKLDELDRLEQKLDAKLQR